VYANLFALFFINASQKTAAVSQHKNILGPLDVFLLMNAKKIEEK